MAEYTPDDTEALREHLRRLIDASAGPGNPTVSLDDLRALLAAILAAEHRATRAETRIKAVEDVLDESEARGPVGMTFNGTPFPAWISIATIRRALTA